MKISRSYCVSDLKFDLCCKRNLDLNSTTLLLDGVRLDGNRQLWTLDIDRNSIIDVMLDQSGGGVVKGLNEAEILAELTNEEEDVFTGKKLPLCKESDVKSNRNTSPGKENAEPFYKESRNSRRVKGKCNVRMLNETPAKLTDYDDYEEAEGDGK